MNQRIQPQGWAEPRGYSNGILARGSVLSIAGQIGWDASCSFVSDDFAEQAAQALRNVVEIVKAAGGSPQHIVRMTWYVTDKRRYREATRALGTIYRTLFGDHYPAMTLLEVRGLLEDRALVEIEATAILP